MSDINENDSLKKLIGLMEKIDSIGKATDGIDERLKKLEGLQHKVSLNEENIKELSEKIDSLNDSRIAFLEEAIDSLKEEVDILKRAPKVTQTNSSSNDSNDIKDKCKQIRGLLDEIENLSDVKPDVPKKPTVVVKPKAIEKGNKSTENKK